MYQLQEWLCVSIQPLIPVFLVFLLVLDCFYCPPFFCCWNTMNAELLINFCKRKKLEWFSFIFMERCIMLLVIELDNTCIMFPAVGCFTCLLQFTMCPICQYTCATMWVCTYQCTTQFSRLKIVIWSACTEN